MPDERKQFYDIRELTEAHRVSQVRGETADTHMADFSLAIAQQLSIISSHLRDLVKEQKLHNEIALELVRKVSQ